ncbi:MAG: hypothetical protein DRP12_00615 [Candidatus Aenigmatarchaeota archaeon]|nr:MAG: hypothetical protein DRP12_00615 [Candidatus Aenigmarchaeota archaeon]
MLYDWFIEPILRNGWFNPINTAVYGILLVLGSWLVFRLLTRLEIRIDLRFAVSLLPFIGWACIARVLKDSATAGLINGIFSSPIWVTPGSYLLTFGLALSCLLISLLLQENFGIAYWKTMLILGTVSCLGLVWMVPRFSPIPPLIVLGITGIWSCLWLFSRKLGMSWENVCILSAHSLDASATVTAVVLFGYLEQHVLPRLLMALSPYSFFLLKFFVLLPVLFLLDRWTEPGQLRTFLKIVILILGLAPGLRSLIRLGVGV